MHHPTKFYQPRRLLVPIFDLFTFVKTGFKCPLIPIPSRFQAFPSESRNSLHFAAQQRMWLCHLVCVG